MLASGHPQSTGVYRKPVYFEGQGLQSAPKIARGVERDRLVRDPSPRRGDGRNGASNCGRCRRPSGPDDDAAWNCALCRRSARRRHHADRSRSDPAGRAR